MTKMSDAEFNKALQSWLEKPPAESVGDVIEKLLASPPEKQESVRKVITKLLGEKPQPKTGPLTPDEQTLLAFDSAWWAFWYLVDIGTLAKQVSNWAQRGVSAGTASPESAAVLIQQFVDTYDAAERKFAPLIDALLRYQVNRAARDLAAAELVDLFEEEVVRLECEAAARRAGA